MIFPRVYVYLAVVVMAIAFFVPRTAFALTNISTCSGLEDIADDLTEDYVLINDIDCSGVPTFTQIGSYGSPFTGTLDGQGYEVSNIHVSTTYAGLFLRIAAGGVVKNLGLVDIDYDASTYSGAFASYLEGTLTHVYASGSLDCTPGAYCGGLAGYTPEATAIVTSSYSNVNLVGGGYLGGIIGRFSTGTIENVYASGIISGSDTNGIIGSVDGGVTPNVTGAYFDATRSTASAESFSNSKTTAQMMTQSTFSDWDFTVAGDGTIGDWIMAGYPHLQMEHRSAITTLAELQLIAVDRTDNYTISNNIDASGTTGWNGGAGFDPIGDNANTFTGSLDGNGYTISGLYIDRPAEEHVSLFGYVDDSGSISNVRVTEADFTGDFIVGGIAGHSNGMMSNVSFSGELVGDAAIGGIAGSNIGTITRASSQGTITGVGLSYYLAGITGNNNGTVINCYSSMDVTGGDRVGGLVGDNYNGGTIRYSYATGAISGSTNVGGLVGRNQVYDEEIEEYREGIVDSSFYDSTTSGQSDTGKGTGKTTAQMKVLATFTDTDTSGLDTVWDFVGTPYDDGGTSSTWEMDPAINSGYAFLAWEQSDTNAPSAVSSLTGSVAESNITLSWTNPTASDFVSITVRRSTSSYPATVSSGTAVTSATTTTGITQTSLDDGRYYYSVFALDNTGNISSAATTSVVVDTTAPTTRGGGTFIVPGGEGSGASDQSVDMYATKHIGEISGEGVNLLVYIQSTALFSLVESSSGKLGEHRLTITDLDLSEQKEVTIQVASTPRTIVLKVGALADMDLDSDGVSDLSVTFTALWNNRVELTLRATQSDEEEKMSNPSPVVPLNEKETKNCPSPLFVVDMKKGYYGPSAMALQQYLNNIGTPVAIVGPGSPGQETAYFGSLTEQALKVFQNKHSFAATGLFDVSIRKYLGCISGTTSVSPTSTLLKRDLEFGMSGEDVKGLQVYLNTNGFPIVASGYGSLGNETTYFGALTRQAVIAFQIAKGISPASGYVGPLTRQELQR